MIGRPVLWALQGLTLAAHGAVDLRAALAPAPHPIPDSGPLRILMLAKYPTRFAGTKYRLTKWGDRLRALGHEVALRTPMSDAAAERLSNDWRLRSRSEHHVRLLARRTRTVWGAGGTDVVVIHMTDLPFWEYGGPFVAQALKRMAGRVLLDLDDLPVIAGEQDVRPQVRELVASVDGLIVGNRRIQEHFPGKPAWFVPTCIDPSEWPRLARRGRLSPLLLGWVGTPGNLAHLEPLAPVLAEFCRKRGARLRIVCSIPPTLPGVPVEFVRWTAAREIEDLLPMDIGLAPLEDGPSQRCKCALKSLQYMAAGIPVVASPVGANSDAVEDGRTGFLASDLAGWAAALDRLGDSEDLRMEMGAAGRRAVEEKWSFARFEPTLLDAIRGKNA